MEWDVTSGTQNGLPQPTETKQQEKNSYKQL
jgi:hypothetical protein